MATQTVATLNPAAQTKGSQMRSRRGFSVIALCGLMLALMAITASAAQAGMWMVNNANVGVGVELHAGFEIEIEKLEKTETRHIVMLTTSGGNAIQILCSKAAAPNVTITLEVITFGAEISECVTFVNGIGQPNCNPNPQPIAVNGTAEAVLHANKPYAELEGAAGVFAVLRFRCAALPAAVNIRGIGWIEDCHEEFEVEKVEHLIQEAPVPAKALGGLLFGANALVVDGSAWIRFSDEKHFGDTFSGLAE